MAIFFIRDWPEIQKSRIPPSEFCPISGDWDELGIPDLAWMTQIKCYEILQNARPTTFALYELLMEKSRRRWGKITPPPLPHPPRLGINMKHEVYLVSLEQCWFYFKYPLSNTLICMRSGLKIYTMKTWQSVVVKIDFYIL